LCSIDPDPRRAIVNRPCRILVLGRNALMLGFSWGAFTFGGFAIRLDIVQSSALSTVVEHPKETVIHIARHASFFIGLLRDVGR
jgi:hypothetical protein